MIKLVWSLTEKQCSFEGSINVLLELLNLCFFFAKVLILDLSFFSTCRILSLDFSLMLRLVFYCRIYLKYLDKPVQTK